MPVTSTSGALTYARLNAGSTAYYAEMNPSNIDLNIPWDISVYGPNVYITLNTTNVASNTNAAVYLTGLLINDSTGPIIQWSKTSNIVGKPGAGYPAGTLTSNQSTWIMTTNRGAVVPAAPQTSWIINANGVGNGTAYDPNNYGIYNHAIDSSNNYYYVGTKTTTYNGVITKYYGSNNNNVFSFEYVSTNNAIVLNDINFETNGNIIIGGFIEFGGYGNTGNYLPFYSKIGSNGSTIHYSKYLNPNYLNNQGFILRMLIDTSNDSIYALLSMAGGTSSNAILKIDNSGNIVWQKQISNTILYSICFDNEKNILVTGSSQIPGTTYPTYSVEYVGKFSATNGSLIWQRGLADNTQNQQYSGTGITVRDDVYYVCGTRHFISQAADRAYYHAFPVNGAILGNGLYSIPNIPGSLTLKYFDISNAVNVTDPNFSSFTTTVTANSFSTSLTTNTVAGTTIINVISAEKQIR